MRRFILSAFLAFLALPAAQPSGGETLPPTPPPIASRPHRPGQGQRDQASITRSMAMARR